MTRPPNILFILIDCLRSRTLVSEQAAGNIPHLDSLIGRGTVFPSTVASATTTTPSVASLLTGTLPMTHGIRSLHGSKLNPGVATLPELLRDKGYETFAEVSGPLIPENGLDRGFDHYHHRRDRVYGPAWDRISARFQALPEDRPWFLFLHFFELHAPRSVPPEFDLPAFGQTTYERALAALDQLRLPDVLGLVEEADVTVVTADHGEIVPPMLRTFQRGVRLAALLRSKRLRYFFHRRFGHGFHVYEDLVLVPTILAGRGVPKGLTVDSAVRQVDVFETILELADLTDVRQRQSAGESLVPFFSEPDREDRPGYSQAIGIPLPSQKTWLVCVRSDGFKYVKRVHDSRSWLWRLPNERRDVSSQYPNVVERMETLLTEFQHGAAPRDEAQGMTADEERQVEAHLQELGYLE